MRDVLLAGGQVDPAQRPSLAAKDAPDRGEALVLVQFVGPVKDEWLAKLQATGATVLGYAAQNGYIVHAAGDALDRVTELVGSYPAVRAATALRPADKVERGAESGRVAVQTVAGAPGADARAEAAGDGPTLGPGLSAVHVRTQFLDLTAAEVADLAADPAVVAVEPAGVPKLHDERAAQIVAGNLTGNAPSGPGYDAWLATEGFTSPFGFAIDVTDSGLDRGEHHRRPPGPRRPGRLRTRLHPRPRRHRLRRPRHERDVDRGRPRHGRRPGRPGLPVRPRRRAVGARRRLEDLPLQRRSGIGELRPAHLRRLRRRRPDLEQLLGHLELRRATTPPRRPTTRSSATRPARRATRRWSRCSPPATTATGWATRPTRRATRATAASARRARRRT